MIQYLSGTLIHKTPVMAIIETMGIGWELRNPNGVIMKYYRCGKPLNSYLFTYHQEDIPFSVLPRSGERELFNAE